jgi:hypothetical protein
MVTVHSTRTAARSACNWSSATRQHPSVTCLLSAAAGSPASSTWCGSAAGATSGCCHGTGCYASWCPASGPGSERHPGLQLLGAPGALAGVLLELVLVVVLLQPPLLLLLRLVLLVLLASSTPCCTPTPPPLLPTTPAITSSKQASRAAQCDNLTHTTQPSITTSYAWLLHTGGPNSAVIA